MTRERVRWLAARAYRAVGRFGRAVFDGPTLPAASLHPDPATPPWVPLSLPRGRAVCNVCRWQGDGFVEPGHVEHAACPACGSNARDRYLHWCFAERIDLHPALRVVECSPRLGQTYRDAMATWFFYRTTDYDLRRHRGNLRLDLQAIELPDACLDVVLCSHVLEHVPDTGKALAELRRVIVPGGHLLLQVPVLQGRTAPPAQPEVHADDTPVYWRFGLDLTSILQEHGFRSDVLCLPAFADAVRTGVDQWPEHAAEFDVPALLAAADPDDLVVVADDDAAKALGLEPAYQFLTWDCT